MDTNSTNGTNGGDIDTGEAVAFAADALGYGVGTGVGDLFAEYRPLRGGWCLMVGTLGGGATGLFAMEYGRERREFIRWLLSFPDILRAARAG